MTYRTHTKLDMVYAARVLSRYMNKPTRIHAGAGKPVLRYLAGTVGYGFSYAYSSKWRVILIAIGQRVWKIGGSPMGLFLN